MADSGVNETTADVFSLRCGVACYRLQVSSPTIPTPGGHFKEKLTAAGTMKQLMPRLKITFPYFNKKPCFCSRNFLSLLPDRSAGLSLCMVLRQKGYQRCLCL